MIGWQRCRTYLILYDFHFYSLQRLTHSLFDAEEAGDLNQYPKFAPLVRRIVDYAGMHRRKRGRREKVEKVFQKKIAQGLRNLAGFPKIYLV